MGLRVEPKHLLRGIAKHLPITHIDGKGVKNPTPVAGWISEATAAIIISPADHMGGRVSAYLRLN